MTSISALNDYCLTAVRTSTFASAFTAQVIHATLTSSFNIFQPRCVRPIGTPVVSSCVSLPHRSPIRISVRARPRWRVRGSCALAPHTQADEEQYRDKNNNPTNRCANNDSGARLSSETTAMSWSRGG
jgi:hypothetical protein